MTQMTFATVAWLESSFPLRSNPVTRFLFQAVLLTRSSQPGDQAFIRPLLSGGDCALPCPKFCTKGGEHQPGAPGVDAPRCALNRSSNQESHVEVLLKGTRPCRGVGVDEENKVTEEAKKRVLQWQSTWHVQKMSRSPKMRALEFMGEYHGP